MNIYKPGTQVYIKEKKFGDNDKPGVIGHINCVTIYSETHALYEIVWWDNCTRHTAWMQEWEFTTEDNKKNFGFIKLSEGIGLSNE